MRVTKLQGLQTAMSIVQFGNQTNVESFETMALAYFFKFTVSQKTKYLQLNLDFSYLRNG
jgi:hypothetical protein